ncbi:MAG TPA: putative Ig domain-containing protein [Bryobacteraceae bacterium]|nr:putative Ig domain-containing protein [Bryobacteraceae bacterium]
MARLLLLIVPIALVASELTISTRDSLSLAGGLYVSILFTASGHGPNGVPSLYRFSESGHIPPGMIFEAYPCNKPDHPPCPSVAKPDGIFLDGVPSTAGSYNIQITATDSKGNKASRRFVVTVK